MKDDTQRQRSPMSTRQETPESPQRADGGELGASHALFAVDDVVVTPRGIRGLAMPGEKFTITEVHPNGWYHLKPHREASGFLARHREISSANL